ncbi:Laps domain containing protein [Asbolus verrucosus]|uniref:Laps domain containing protein n=1 Tax=Asbolus verrucosus TaxID=1661398 RepID=A0A482VM62_ASBVE|nr:Laps domain containing protein [Asbolus verrucosus]
MAKSIRSKWKRKCRAIKRERYGKKELERLKKTLGIDGQSKDVDMTEISEIAKVTDAKTIKKKEAEDSQMDTNTNKRVFNSKTLRDQHGTYPVWLHPRKIVSKKSKKAKKGKKKQKH